MRTINKKKGNRKVLRNWREIFLTVSISKIYEKFMLNRQISVIEKEFSEAATRGSKDRSKLGHLFIWQAINDYYKYLKCAVKFVYLDLGKAFGKLWLKSCIVDMFRSGVKGNSLTNFYELNNERYIEIHTLSGITGEVEIKENLKQGTISAAPICANDIDKGMQVVKKENVGIYFGNILIPPLLYQDDILIASISHNKMLEMVTIAEEFQKKILLNFNVNKCEQMVMRYSKSKQVHNETLILNGKVIKAAES